jgi:RsiW-degrading membrane proteinase PrsW (M82 family)
MGRQWFYKSGGREHGPVGSRQLLELAQIGRLLPTDHVRLGTDGSWAAAQKIQGLVFGNVPNAAPSALPAPTVAATTAHMQYYLMVADTRVGPLGLEELKQRAIEPDLPIWRWGLPQWLPASQLPELQFLFLPPPAPPQRSPRTPSDSRSGQLKAMPKVVANEPSPPAALVAIGKDPSPKATDEPLPWETKRNLLLGSIVGLHLLPYFGPPPGTLMIWLMAGAAALAGFVIFWLLLQDKKVQLSDEATGLAMGTFLFTAVVGVVFLLIFQWVASLAVAASNVNHLGNVRGTVLLWLVRVIGYCYSTALSDSPGGFWATLFAMLFSVGVCEELIKLLPAAYLWQHGKIKTPHELFFIAALSGLGFGVSEGIHYAFEMYRPLEAPFSIYLLRFFGVAIGHGLWTLVASIVYWSVVSTRPAAPVPSAEGPPIFTWDLACVFASAIPHALYNSLLTHQHAFLAGVTNVVTIVAVTSYLEDKSKTSDVPAT